MIAHEAERRRGPALRNVRYDNRMRCAAAACVLLLFVAGRAEAQLQGQVYASGFQSPVAFVQDPTDRTVQFVVQQTGRIRVVRNGTVLATDFLNLTSSVSRAASKDCSASRSRPITRRADASSSTSRTRLATPSSRASCARPIRSSPIRRPDSICSSRGRGASSRSHFQITTADIWRSGPMGISTSASATAARATTPTTVRRIRANCSARCSASTSTSATADAFGYRVPPDNPFLGGDNVRDEIWAFGLRNPWRYSFDDVARGGTGALVIGDVGQNRREEINYEPRGAGGRNYGWRNREGTRDNVTSRPLAYLRPRIRFSITGAAMASRSRADLSIEALGWELPFADGIFSPTTRVVSGRSRSRSTARERPARQIGASIQPSSAAVAVLGTISSFGVDADGELYVVNHSAGRIVRITAPLVTPPVPAGLKIIKP